MGLTRCLLVSVPLLAVVAIFAKLGIYGKYTKWGAKKVFVVEVCVIGTVLVVLCLLRTRS